MKLCPSIQASALYYSVKLKIHNYTIYDLATGDCSNYWLQESEGDLEASVFASILIKIFENKSIEPLYIIIYSDGCGYQNRNSMMSDALLEFSKFKNIKIEQKFLIKGHTQVECDSIHSLIECKLKNKNIFLPSDYVRTTVEARNPPKALEAILFTHDYFLDFNV